MKKKTGLFLIIFFIISGLSAQTDAGAKKGVSIYGGTGILIFNGNVGTSSDVSDYSRIRIGYNFGVEKHFGDWLTLGLDGLAGKLAQSERSKTSNFNFESKIMQGDLRLTCNFDNGIIFKKDAMGAPYLFAGVGFLLFDSYTDLKGADGKYYNYWTDGSIRDLPQTAANLQTAKIVQRDYVYETQLKDSLNNYPRNSVIIPLGAGFKMKFSDHLGVNLGFTYYLTFTDHIGNIKKSGNDSYYYVSMALKYTIYKTKKDEEAAKYKDIDFAKIDNIDADGDGVRDAEDRCPGTPKGIKVDGYGCPLDSDNDGVPDYLDKEPKSKRGAVVNENGVTITDAMIQEQAKRDSIGRARENVFTAAPNIETLKKIDKEVTSGTKHSLPKKFESADKNNDGLISSDEITAAIDSFFEGSSDITVERINELIDYFFEQ